MLLAQISHILIQGMADLESFKESLTHRSTVGHPHPQMASRGLSPVLWPWSSEACGPGKSKRDKPGGICIDFFELMLELTQHHVYAFLLIKAVPVPVPRT